MALASFFVLATLLGPPERVAADDPALVEARAAAIARVEAATKERKVVPLAPRDVELGSADVVWVSGSGHGQTLDFGRLTASGEGGRLLVVRVRRAGNAEADGYPHDEPWPLEVRRRAIERDEWRDLLLTLASVARTELAPIPAPPAVRNEDGSITVRGSGGWSSSRDFCAAVRTTGLDAPWTAAFAGYASSRAEPRFAAPSAAVGLLRDAARGEGAHDAPVDDVVRAAFAEALTLVRPHLESSGWWWVRERVLVAGGRVAAPAVVPYALEVAGRAEGEGASHGRSRHRAVTALALVTGEELRFDETGAPRPIGEIAAAYAALLEG